MRIPDWTWYITVFIITAFSFIIEMGIPFCVIGVFSILGLMNFNWGYVFIIWAFVKSFNETEILLRLHGVIKESDNKDGN